MCYSSFVKYITLYLNRDNIFIYFINYARIFSCLSFIIVCLYNLPVVLYFVKRDSPLIPLFCPLANLLLRSLFCSSVYV